MGDSDVLKKILQAMDDQNREMSELRKDFKEKLAPLSSAISELQETTASQKSTLETALTSIESITAEQERGRDPTKVAVGDNQGGQTETKESAGGNKHQNPRIWKRYLLGSVGIKC